MIVSTNWLKEYVNLSMTVDELTDRLTLTGLNLEGVENIDDDVAIDLEVTSNRPDCLGHIGVAREISVLWEQELKKPPVDLKESGTKVDQLTSVAVECPDLCPRYTARVIRGVKIGPSPAWLTNRLKSLGIAAINNVVDISNYVMMESGQPLHTFDFAKLTGQKIIVRHSQPGEKFTAINHQEYELAEGTCVIADEQRAVALAGVMGGADTEVSAETTDLLIEAADFDLLTVRNTARRHNLQSDSSYRFERGVDPEGIDWASRRCCQLILELAGGELADGVIDVAQPAEPRPTIKLRFPELPRILGIEVATEKVQKILAELGCEETHICDHCIKAIPPSWRADLTREIDLIEEIARIHGYEQIPEDSGVKMVASQRTLEDRVYDQVRGVLTTAGFDEAMTLSAVDRKWVDMFRPWSTEDPLVVGMPILRRADCLRQTLVPSLLAARRTNETLSNSIIELFEIANIYLAQPGQIPAQRRMLAITSGSDFAAVKGVIEALVAKVAPGCHLEVSQYDDKFFATGRGAQISLGGHQIGFLGEVSQAGLDQFELRSGTTIAEFNLDMLVEAAVPIRAALSLSPYPPVGRDLNIVLDESVCWADVERIVRTGGGELLESIAYQETYRDADRLGADKKSILLSIVFRSATETLTNEQADEVRDRIVGALGKELGGELRV